VLGLVVGGIGGALVGFAPLPARGAPKAVLLRNGYAAGVDAGTPSNGPVWMLVVGSDTSPGESSADPLHANADSIQLIGMNPATGAAVIVGFPRDSWVPIPGFGRDKINAALSDGGPAKLAETVESVSGIHPQYTLLTSFEGFEHMVDRLGGITVTVPISMHDHLSGSDFEPGVYHFKGGEALAFTRDRHIPGGDFRRSFHQGLLLRAVLSQLQGRAKEMGRVEAFISIFLDENLSDVAPAEAFRLARLAMTVDPAKVQNLVLPGGVGAAGPLSIVVLDEVGTKAIFDEIRADATLKSPPPPIPNI
jgi:LCP family protein required for cell wall assembly